MYDHLLDNGIARNYVRWLMHGEYEFYEPTNTGNSGTNESDMHDEMKEMLNDAFGMSMPNEESERSPHVHEEFESIPNENANTFYNLLREAEHELYPECKKFTKLSFIIRQFHMKCLNGWNCKTWESSNFLKNGKMVISVKIHNFSRSWMIKRTSPLESSHEIYLPRRILLNSETAGISRLSRYQVSGAV